MQTVFIVGNGAIEDGWSPLKRALATALSSDLLNRLELDPSEYLSNLVFQLRILSARLKISGQDNELEALFKERYEFRKVLLEKISASFSQAEKKGEIYLQVPENEEFRKLFEAKSVDLIT